MPGASIEGVTGRLGVGAIAFLGLFLLVDGLRIGTFELIEVYGKSVTWGLIGIVPTAVVTYIVGVFCVGLADLLLSRFAAFHGIEPRDVLSVSRLGGPLHQQLFGECIRRHELLKGASVSFLILSAGSLSELCIFPGYGALIWLAAICAIALSALSLVFSHRAIVEARAFAKAVSD